MNRLTKAFLLTPLAPAMLVTLISLNPMMMIVAIPFSYACVLAVGVPTYLLVQRVVGVSYLSCAVGGALAVALISIASSLLDDSLELSFYYVSKLVIGSALGVFTGTVFWWLAGKPNKPLKNDARKNARAS